MQSPLGGGVVGLGGAVVGLGGGAVPPGPMPVTSPLPPSNVTSEQPKKFSGLSERTQRE